MAMHNLADQTRHNIPENGYRTTATLSWLAGIGRWPYLLLLSEALRRHRAEGVQLLLQRASALAARLKLGTRFACFALQGGDGGRGRLLHLLL
jgi:hypothetical protein